MKPTLSCCHAFLSKTSITAKKMEKGTQSITVFWDSITNKISTELPA